MIQFIAQRLLAALPVMLGVSVCVFMMVHVAPGDPVVIMLGMQADAAQIERVREDMGFNDPLFTQYFRFLSGAVTGDLGRSLKSGRSVTHEIAERLPRTIELAVTGMALAAALGILLGVLAATHHRRLTDTITMLMAILGVSVPSFWLGIMMIFLFSVHLRILPVAGVGTWKHLILPAVALAVQAAAVLARMTRSGVLEVLRKDYVRTARAKGLAERAVLYRHALRNALIPVVTIAGLQFGALLGGTVIIETLFAWPGLGRLAVESIMSRDFPMIQGIVLYLALGYVLMNLLVDLTYGYLDPRIRYQ